MGVCYLTPKAHTAPHGPVGHGAFATEFIAAGEVIAAFGGRCVSRNELDLLPAEQQSRSIQIEDTLYLAGAPEPEPADCVRHSCSPNAGIHVGHHDPFEDLTSGGDGHDRRPDTSCADDEQSHGPSR